jgi:hypothetical protein
MPIFKPHNQKNMKAFTHKGFQVFNKMMKIKNPSKMEG